MQQAISIIGNCHAEEKSDVRRNVVYEAKVCAIARNLHATRRKRRCLGGDYDAPRT